MLPQEVFFHVHDEILADGGKRGLLHNFQPNHRLSLAPLGFVAAEGRAGCLILTTFHTFPDEHAVVIYGYDNNGVHMMDVGDGGFYYTEWDSFLRRWGYFDEMALAIFPR